MIDRGSLANFIESAARGTATSAEWSQFAVNHYLDPAMERARVECVRLLGGVTSRTVTAEDLEALRQLAKELRIAT